MVNIFVNFASRLHCFDPALIQAELNICKFNINVVIILIITSRFFHYHYYRFLFVRTHKHTHIKYKYSVELCCRREVSQKKSFLFLLLNK